MDYQHASNGYMSSSGPVVYHQQGFLNGNAMYHGLDMNHEYNNNHLQNQQHHHQTQQMQQQSHKMGKQAGAKKTVSQKATTSKKRGSQSAAINNELNSDIKRTSSSALQNCIPISLNNAPTMLIYNNEEIPMVVTSKEVKVPKREPTSPTANSNQVNASQTPIDVYQPSQMIIGQLGGDSASKPITQSDINGNFSTAESTNSNSNMITIQTVTSHSNKTIPKIPTVNPASSKFIITKITNRLNSNPLLGNVIGGISQLKALEITNNNSENSNNTVSSTTTTASSNQVGTSSVATGTQQLVKLVSYSKDPMLASSSVGSPTTSSSPAPSQNSQQQQTHTRSPSTSNSVSISANSTGGDHLQMACLVNGGSDYN